MERVKSLRARRRIDRHRDRLRRDPEFVVAIDHGVVCSDELIADVLRAGREDIDRQDDPAEALRLRRAGHPRPIYAGRRHTPIRMYNREGVPRRDVAAFGRYAADGSFTVYRYGTSCTVWRPVAPADGVAPPYDMAMFPWIRRLVDVVTARTGEVPNHCIVTRYTDRGDSISAHRDKTLDIMPGTHIHAFSFGATRSFRCTHMDISPREWDQRHETASGGLLSIPYDTNLEYKHQILPGEGTRVSVVLRTCRTRYDPCTGASLRLASAEPPPEGTEPVRSAAEVNRAKAGSGPRD